MGKFRIERDPIGDVRVPASAYFGGQTARAVENFPISGLTAPPALITATVLIKKAAAEANESLGRLEPALARAIVAAADEVLAGKLRGEFVVDVYQAGAGTSHNMNTNEVLANRAAELLGEKLGNYERIHPNDHVNMGQSTNDVYPTATRLAILFALKDLLTASARAVGPPRGEEPRVRGCPQDGAHASAGRGTHHARPGVWRLRRERRARNRRSRAHGVATARAEPRCNRRRYGAERRRRLHQARDSQPGAIYRAAVAPFAESLSYHAEHGRCPRLFRRAPAAGRGGGKSRVRPSPAQHGAACRHRRDSVAGRAAGVVDHAGQGQPFGP